MRKAIAQEGKARVRLRPMVVIRGMAKRIVAIRVMGMSVVVIEVSGMRVWEERKVMRTRGLGVRVLGLCECRGSALAVVIAVIKVGERRGFI